MPKERLPCDVNGCERPRKGRRPYCYAHWARFVRHGDPGPAHIRKARYADNEKCSVPSCDDKPTRKGMCYHHYKKDYDRRKKNQTA